MARRRNAGTSSTFSEAVAATFCFSFDDKKETRTYKEAAKTSHVPTTTFWRYATTKMDFRCLGNKVRPMPSAANRAKRVVMARHIVANKGIFKNEFHQDEKYFIQNSNRRKRKKRRSDVEGSNTVSHAHHRRH